MSKSLKCMQQPTEIPGVAKNPAPRLIWIVRNLLRCGVALAVIASAAACTGKQQNHVSPSAQDHSDKSVRILRRGLPGEPRTLDPQLADDTFSFPVLRDLYEGLTAEDRNGRIVPGVAESWTIDKSGTVYTFLLRPNAKWSDGERTTASEFVQGLHRAVDPQTASGSSALLEVIKGASDIIAGRKKVAELGVTAIGDSSVRIELEHPAPFVLQILSQPIAAPVHIRSSTAVGISVPTDKLKISNGAYTLVSSITGSFIELARNPNYWDASNVLIDRVRYINAESEST